MSFEQSENSVESQTELSSNTLSMPISYKDNAQLLASRLKGDASPYLSELRISYDSESANTNDQSVEQNFGVSISRTNDHFHVSMRADGTETTLHSLSSDVSQEEIARQLTDLRQEKIRELESVYFVDVKPAGTRVEIPQRDGTLLSYSTREPSLAELEGLEAALMRSQPTSVSGDQRVPINFIREDGQGNTRASYLPEINDGPAIHVWPKSRDFPPTQLDDTRTFAQRNSLRGMIRGSLEEILIHEFGHRAADNLDVLTDESASIAEQLGFHRVAGGEPQDSRWVLRGRDGYFYDEFAGGWYRVNSEGQALDEGGNPVEVKQSFKITDDQLSDYVVVAPASDYSVNPDEVFAEGILYFRLNSWERATLLSRSPELYRTIKNYDQQEINNHYGVDAAGQPRYLRSPDGSLVESNSQSNADILAFEQRAIQNQSAQ